MNKKLFKLPIFTLIGGTILRVVNHIIISLMVRGTNEWTFEMGTKVFYFDLILSIVIFISIGIILRRTYDRGAFIKSATLLVIYSILVLGLEQITQYFDMYNSIFLLLYLPIEIFTIITSLLVRVSTAESIIWIYAVPSLFAPYIFILFGKQSDKSN